MHVIDDTKYEILNGFVDTIKERLDNLEADGLNESPDEYSYHIGALHAFEDSLGFVDDVDGKRTELNATPFVLAVVVGGSVLAYVNRDKVKSLAKKFNKKLRRS